MSAVFSRPRRHCRTLLLLLASITPPTLTPPLFAQTTHNVNANEHQAYIQFVISAAHPGDTVAFAAGTYSVSSSYHMSCGVNMTGPAVSPAYVANATSTNLEYVPTATLVATSYKIGNIFVWPSCSTATSVEYLHFSGAGGITMTPNISNATILYNKFDHIPGGYGGYSSGVYFNGDNTANQFQNIIVNWNNFGDSTSCTAPIDLMTSTTDEGGSCNGIQIHAGVTGMQIENNVFYNLENGGPKIVCTGSGSLACVPAGGCGGCDQVSMSNITITGNDFNSIHRIGLEIQPQPFSTLVVNNNTFEHQYLPQNFSMGFSLACCGQGGRPGQVTNNNVLIADVKPVPPAIYIAYALEWWGKGAQADHNLVQGWWAHCLVYGQGDGGWEVKYTIMNGIYCRGQRTFIENEGQGATTAPTQAGNVLDGTTPGPTYTSVAPTISPVPTGTYSSNIAVTLSDRGLTSGAGPLGNTSIFYTIDGSKPVPNSGTTLLYTSPLSVKPGTTVNAVGMYGQNANTLTYPSGYGYVPSGVVSAHYVARSGGTPAQPR